MAPIESISFIEAQASLSMHERLSFGSIRAMSAADRIRQVRKDSGLTQEGFAARLSAHLPEDGAITRGAVGNWERDQGIKRSNLELIARVFDVSFEWLATGRGAPEAPTPAKAIDVVLVSWVSAGRLTQVDLQDEAIGEITMTGLDPKGDWIAFRVEGDSMDRISPPESIIFVNRRDKRLVPNGLYVVADGDGAATYKRYRPNPDRFEPVSANKDLEPLYPDHEPLIVGRVRRTVLDM